jgi:hypothetical protein
MKTAFTAKNGCFSVFHPNHGFHRRLLEPIPKPNVKLFYEPI